VMARLEMSKVNAIGRRRGFKKRIQINEAE